MAKSTSTASIGCTDLAVDPLISCKLCLMEHPLQDMHPMEQCSCIYCYTCLQQYLSILIKEGSVAVVTCPDAMCKEEGKIGMNEIKRLVDKSTYDKYIKYKFELEVDLDPNRTWCPEAGCETICHVCSGDAAKAKPVHCPTCGLHFCSLCKSKWHSNKTCDEFSKDSEASGGSTSYHTRTNAIGIPFSSDENAPIKRCPLCHVPIERDEGCAQMMCKRCKHVFCWYCLASLDDDFLLRHYDKGPCRDKLGHSRASVIWHRTQVVGIFAGFGVLLLVASPFLLLAAPCILCCKCKVCRCCDDDDDGISGLPS
ncbi:probable E3 ubiquitin-protein ligase RNF144A-A [Ptychodera flava]|uniref:probable E3 ubiquitin-protein ligase RNF144A-A n=1 Tax=Ptychodera flava TaxID=63121 RepID=UPI00396A72EF